MKEMKGLVVALGDVQGGSFPQAIVVRADSIDELKQMPFLGRVTIRREDKPPHPADAEQLTAAKQLLRDIVNYREKAGALGFQLEKLDDLIRAARVLLELDAPAGETTK